MKVIHLSNKIFFPFFHIQNLLKKNTRTRFEQLFQKHFFPFRKYILKRMNKKQVPHVQQSQSPQVFDFYFFNSQTIMVIDILTTIKSRHVWFIPV